MKSATILCLLVLLAACSTSDQLATCKGPIFALNAGHWEPAPSDLKAPPDLKK